MGMPFVCSCLSLQRASCTAAAHTWVPDGRHGRRSLISALSLAARKSVRGLVRMIPIAAAVFGLGLIGFGLSRVFWLRYHVAIAGMGMMQGWQAAIRHSDDRADTSGPRDELLHIAFVVWRLSAACSQVRRARHRRAFDGDRQRSCCYAGRAWFWTQLPAVRRVMRPIYEEMAFFRGVRW